MPNVGPKVHQPTSKITKIPESESKCTEDKITKKEVSAAIAQVEAQLKVNDYMNLVGDEGHASMSGRSPTWSEVVKKKRRKQVIIGNNRESAGVVGVPSYAALHIYRLNPQTTSEELTELMKKHFPKVRCESLNSKHPELYSSFKVTILASNFRKAMDSDLWPFGACVSRFFMKRKTNVETT